MTPSALDGSLSGASYVDLHSIALDHFDLI